MGNAVARPASSEAAAQAARPALLWPITATVAVIKAFAAIKGEAQPLTPVPGGGAVPEEIGGGRPTPVSLARFDTSEARDPDAELSAASAAPASGEDTAPAIEPLPQAQSGSGSTSRAAAPGTAAGGTGAPASAPGASVARAEAPRETPLADDAGTGAGQAPPAEAAGDETTPAADSDTAERSAGEEGTGPPADPMADAPSVHSPSLDGADDDPGYGYTLIGGDGDDDALVGTLRNDDVDGHRGDDRLKGLAGADILRGGPGDDHLDGGEGDDSLWGGLDDDTLLGGSGADRLAGGAGSDALLGEDGDDTLIGRLGRDELSGMAGADRFVFTSVADSPAGAPDRVLDFSAFEHDVLDLSAIDANAWTEADDAFFFIDQNSFSGTPGELRVDQLRHHVTLQGDVDGDGSADLGITLLGVDASKLDDATIVA